VDAPPAARLGIASSCIHERMPQIVILNLSLLASLACMRWQDNSVRLGVPADVAQGFIRSHTAELNPDLTF